jgi:excisionase family DNA binding protein
MPANDQHLTPDELADRWKRSAEWIRRAAARGDIPGIKVGALWRFSLADIETYENRHKTADPMSIPPRVNRRRTA